MPRPTKVVVYFDDGSTLEQSLAGISSIFVDEAAAKRCQRMPPYRQGPPSGGTELMATTTGAGGQCYYINGMIFCT